VIVPIILAAGAGSRMGRCKASLALRGRPALAWVLDACRGLGEPIIVAGAHVEAVRKAAGSARVVTNADWERGRATSVRAGLDALPAGAEAFLLWPVDVPLAGAAVPLLVEAYERRSAKERAWVPSYAGKRGHPLLLARSVETELRALTDDQPVRDVVRALDARGELRHVLCEDPLVLEDMDTLEDHARLEAELARRGT
jgi:CTP:molybdopterin cytidylyltransferase MocA